MTEVRLIDSKDDSQLHHAGKIVGSPLKTISSNNRTTHKFSESHDHPAPFSYLRLRALESQHHAGTTEQEDGNAGNQTFVRLHPVIPSDRAAPTFYFGCPAPSQSVSKEVTVTCYRPSSGPHSILENQNADGTARSHFLLSSKQISPVQNGSARTLPHRPSAPNSSVQNAGRAEVLRTSSSVRNSEKASPPGRKTQLPTRSPCAQFIQTGVIGMGRLASPFRRFLSYLWGKSAFNDESKEMTNFGWRKKT